MKTSCPLMWLVICTAPGMFGETTPSCNGPNCQLWHKCRRPDQCPVCGKTCSIVQRQDDTNYGYYRCEEHGVLRDLSL